MIVCIFRQFKVSVFRVLGKCRVMDIRPLRPGVKCRLWTCGPAKG